MKQEKNFAVIHAERPFLSETNGNIINGKTPTKTAVQMTRFRFLESDRLIV